MNGREASRLGRRRARAARLLPDSAVLPELGNSPRSRNSSRAQGSSPRQLGTNPRAQGTNPSAGTRTDAERHARMLRQARARFYCATGEHWCPSCDDVGVVDTGDGWQPCPDHRFMSYGDAWLILHPEPDS